MIQLFFTSGLFKLKKAVKQKFPTETKLVAVMI